jgi:pyruvate kinase
MLQKLMRAGMDIARLNLSHAVHREHAHHIETIRRLSRRTGTDVAILIDLPGPKYRIGRLQNDEVGLKKGDHIRLTTDDIEGDASILPVNLPTLARDARVGDTVILADGALQLKVREIEGSEIMCRVSVGGRLRPGKGLVIPGRPVSTPFITDQLRENVLFAIGQQPDYLALSFVTSPADIEGVREIFRAHGADIPIITKIERGEAVRNFNRILTASDGIMIARGDLGVEIPLEQVPLVQKEIIRKCNRAGKPVITATEMLESMIESPRPTRAETTDVANAIFDGTDAIMLSAETSVGKYPVQAVSMMAGIARAVERKLPYEQFLAERRGWLERETDELISYNACQSAYSLRAAAIVAFTKSGSTAIRVSKYRPGVPILAITPSETVSGRLLLYWGVHPIRVTEPASVDDLFGLGAKLARETGVARAGDLIVVTAGIPVGEPGSTNMLRVETVTG